MRYILPVVPLLSILTVMGVVNIWNWSMNLSIPFRNVLATVLIVFLIIMMSKNIFYIRNYFQNISPMNYISGKESRDEFLTRRNSSYPAIKYINTHTPENARIRLIFLAGRGYYLDRIYSEGTSYGIGDVSGLAANSYEESSFQAYLHTPDCTYMLVRTDLYLKYLQDNYSPETANQLFRQMNKATEMIYNANGYAVYRLIPQK